MARRNPSRLTLGDFVRTGQQDCANVIDADSFMEVWRKHPHLAAKDVVERVWKEWEEDGMREIWLEQQGGDFDGLDPGECYESWRAGWKGCATRSVAQWIDEMRDDIEENPRKRKRR